MNTIGCENCEPSQHGRGCRGCNVYVIWKFAERYLIGEYGRRKQITKEIADKWNLEVANDTERTIG